MSLQKVRILVAVLAASFLMLCHAAYLVATSQGRQQEFANQVDRPPIQMLSIALLLAIIALAIVKDKEADGGQ